MPRIKAYAPKSYVIEESMSGNWIERWSGFYSLRAAKSFARSMDSHCHGKLRIVRLLREPIDWSL